MKKNVKQVVTIVVLVIVFLSEAYSKPTRKYRYDAEFLDSEIQRIRSGRAESIDPVWNNNRRISERYVPTPRKEEVEKNSMEEFEKAKGDSSTSNEEDEGSDSEGSNDDYYTSSEEIEITCAPDKGWHIRGQRCVPLNCPGGPAERDFNTGECLYSNQPRGRFNRPFHQWNDLNHVYRSSPMSSHFVRSMILMRKG